MIGGSYSTCSESCRLELSRSVAAGNTTAYQNPIESGLKLLLKVFLVLGIGSYITTQCGSGSTSQPKAATTMVESSDAPAAEVRQKELPRPQQGFGEPGQFDGAPAADSEPDAAASEEEIHTMPAPVPEGADPVEADSSGTS
jgi:hypothetical protein